MSKLRAEVFLFICSVCQEGKPVHLERITEYSGPNLKCKLEELLHALDGLVELDLVCRRSQWVTLSDRGALLVAKARSEGVDGEVARHPPRRLHS
jgi:hypothetical protein